MYPHVVVCVSGDCLGVDRRDKLALCLRSSPKSDQLRPEVH